MRLPYQLPQPDALRKKPIPPPTFDTVRVRVTKAHFQLRRLVNVGEVISLIEPDAESAVALHRAERI